LNDFPDVLGMELHDVKALLEAEGLAFNMIETKPAKKELTDGVLRVIRVQPRVFRPNPEIDPESGGLEGEKGIVLTVCRI
jgi:hypothetical protein